MRFSFALRIVPLLLGTVALANAEDNVTHHRRPNLRGGGDAPSKQEHHFRHHHRRTNQSLMKRVIVTYEPGQREGCIASMKQMAPSLVMEHEFEPQHAIVVMGIPDDVDLLETAEYVLEVEEDVPRYPLGIFHPPEEWNNPAVPWTAAANPIMAAAAASSATTTLADDLPYGLGLVQAPDLWQYGIRGQGVTVCVIDSGVDSTHEDLSNVSGFSGQSNLLWNEDVIGHGTHVAGTIAARDNGIGVVGVAPEASIYVVRVFSDGGDFLFSSGLVAAVNECVAAGATVINMSLGGPLGSNFENNAFANLLSQGVIPIAAAGNDGTTDFAYPASYSGVMSVAAVDSGKNLASFSQSNSMVDIAGPGVLVRSTLPMTSPCGVCNEIGSFRYGSLSGTSMACPHVAGIAALLRSFQPSASASEIQQAMIDSAQDLGSSGRDDSFGYGLVQGLAAAELLNGGALGGDDATNGENPSPPQPTNSPPTNSSPTNAPPSDASCNAGSLLFRLDLSTDQFGGETYWTLRRTFDGASISESNYGNEGYYVEEACLSTSECYTFTIFDSGQDGLCCSFGQGSYTVTYGGEVIKTGGSFSSSEEVSIGSCERNENDNPVSGTCGQGLVSIDVFLRTDSFASETSLRLVDENGGVLEFASGLSSNTDYELTECVSPDGCYTATVFDSFGDGLSSGTDGIFIVSFDGVEQGRATTFGSEVTVEMGNGCIA